MVVDSWTVDGSQWNFPYTFRVVLQADRSTRPEKFDCFDTEDIDAWKRDKWEFVAVYVTPVGAHGEVYEPATDDLSGVVWGELPGTSIDRKYLEKNQIKEMVPKVVENAEEIRRKMGIK